MKTAKHITTKPRGPQREHTQPANGKSELQHEFSAMQSKGKQIFKSVSNIAKQLDWTDYAKLGVAGAVGIYAFRKRSTIVSLAAPIVMGMLTDGITKAKEFKKEFIHA